jgi:hypothetical protein
MFVLGVILYFCRVCENDPHFVARPTKWKPNFVVGRQSCEKPLVIFANKADLKEEWKVSDLFRG